MEKAYEVRREFLLEFVKFLIVNSRRNALNISDKHSEYNADKSIEKQFDKNDSAGSKKNEDDKNKSLDAKSKIDIKLTEHPEEKKKNDLLGLKVSANPINLPYNLMQRAGRVPRPLVQKKAYIPPKMKTIAPQIPLPLSSLAKIESLIRDPGVSSIECIGPDTPLNVISGGFSRSTPTRFTAQEIERLLNELSQKTKIPRIPGNIFKAAIGNLIITSLNSSYLGNRFIIQKK